MMTTEAVTIGFGVATLAAAVFLLVVAFGLARVAEGSAMADNIRWVMLGAICVATNVLVAWVARFVSDPATRVATDIAGDGLMILGLVFLCVYFYRVRAAMQRFVVFAHSAEELLVQVQSDVGSEEVSSSPPEPDERD